MSKLYLILFAAVLFALAPALTLGGKAQEATPTPAPALTTPPAPEQAPAPVAGPVAPGTQNPVKPTAESQAKAKSVYQIDCALCHGDNGNGKTDVASSMGLSLPDWTDPKTLANKEDWELFNIIRNGKDKMPPEAQGRASDTEVWNLILYIRSLSQPLAPASPAK